MANAHSHRVSLVRQPPLPAHCSLAYTPLRTGEGAHPSVHQPRQHHSLSHVDDQQRRMRMRTEVRNHKHGYSRRLKPCECKRGPSSTPVGPPAWMLDTHVEASTTTKANPPHYLRPTKEECSGKTLTPPLTPHYPPHWVGFGIYSCYYVINRNIGILFAFNQPRCSNINSPQIDGMDES